MDPQLAHLRDLVGLLMAVMLIVALLVYLIPVDCDRCAHCRQERVKRHAEARPWLRFNEPADPFCPMHRIRRSQCKPEWHDGD